MNCTCQQPGDEVACELHNPAIAHLHAQLAKAKAALELAVEALSNCKEDRHYHGSFARHEDTLKQIEEMLLR
jgi:hypothetical protein